MKNGADNWWDFARTDLRSAELLLNEGIYTQACFHAQQAVKKALKAAIAERGETPPKTHSTVRLAAQIAVDLRDFASDLQMFDSIYLPSRYPDALPGTFADGVPGEKHARRCVESAREIVGRVEQFLKEKGAL